MDEDDVVDPSLILPEGSKRTRRVPERYVDENYLKLMTEDVPESELDAALVDSCSDAEIETDAEDDSEDEY